MNMETIEGEIPVEGGKIVPTVTDPIPASIQALIGSEQFSNAMNQLKTAEVGASITGGYREFNEPGVSVRAIFVGMTQNHKYEIDPKTRQQVRRDFDGARFVSDTGTWINSGKTLVDAVRTIKPGTPVQITFVGEKDNKNGPGKTKIFDVKTLNVSGVDKGPRSMTAENVRLGREFLASFVLKDGKVYTKEGAVIGPKEHNQIAGGFNRVMAELITIGYEDDATAMSVNASTDAEKVLQTAKGLAVLQEHFDTENIQIPF